MRLAALQFICAAVLCLGIYAGIRLNPPVPDPPPPFVIEPGWRYNAKRHKLRGVIRSTSRDLLPHTDVNFQFWIGTDEVGERGVSFEDLKPGERRPFLKDGLCYESIDRVTLDLAGSTWPPQGRN